MTDLSQSSSGRVYQIEVCQLCGGQLKHRYNRAGQGGSAPNGRCGTDESHWSAGAVLLNVAVLPLDEQPLPHGSLRYLVAAGVVPDNGEVS